MRKRAIIYTRVSTDEQNNGYSPADQKIRLHKYCEVSKKRSLKLVDVGRKKGDKESMRQYWNAFHCQELLTTAGTKQHGHYCKNRVCALCCSIRKAIIINKYKPVIEKWQNPYMVGLTINSVPAGKLKCTIDDMFKAFRKIVKKHQKRNLRGIGIKLTGIKSLECEFNAEERTYNPHFHIIVSDRLIAKALVNEWCRLWPRSLAHAGGQYFEPVRSKKKSLVEIIKYGSKIFSEPDFDKKLQQKVNSKIYAAALHNILNAMKGHRIFERFGFNLPRADKPKKGGEAVQVTIYEKWVYNIKQLDWVGLDSDEVLTDYVPPPDLLDILEHRIDVDIE